MTALTQETPPKPTRRQGLCRHLIDGEALLYDEQADLIHRLNTTGLFIWDLCDGTLGPDDIAERMTAVYDVPLEIARADVRQAIQEMADNGLLDGVGPATP
jgi:hypothetical protein